MKIENFGLKIILNSLLLPLILFLLFLPLYYFRQTTTRQNLKPGDLVRITSTVASEPILRGENQYFVVRDISITTPRFPEVHYGQTVQATGVLEDSTRGLRLNQPDITVISQPGVFPQLKSRINELFSQTLPSPESALLSGIVLGTKSDLPPHFIDALKTSGTIHVVVASGMNVTLFANFVITSMVFFTKRRLALLGGLTGVWLYVLLIGFEPPIVRAAFMGSLVFFAQATGRITNAWGLLFLSGMIMLLIWPHWISDIGFLLSFAATGGILAFEKPIESLVKRIKGLPEIIRQDFSVSLAAQIPTAPLLYFFFGRLSLLSPIVNAVLLWTVAPMMVLGFLGGIIGVVLAPLGKLIILFTYPLAFWFVKIVEIV